MKKLTLLFIPFVLIILLGPFCNSSSAEYIPYYEAWVGHIFFDDEYQEGYGEQEGNIAYVNIYDNSGQLRAEAEATVEGWDLKARSWAKADSENYYASGAIARVTQEFLIEDETASVSFSYSGALSVLIHGGYPTESDYPWYDDYYAFARITASDDLEAGEIGGNSYSEYYQIFDRPGDSEEYGDTFTFSYADLISQGLINIGDTVSITYKLETETYADCFYKTDSAEMLADFFNTFSITGYRGMTPVDPPASVAPVPEPSTILLIATGLLGIAGAGRKKLLKGQ